MDMGLWLGQVILDSPLCIELTTPHFSFLGNTLSLNDMLNINASGAFILSAEILITLGESHRCHLPFLYLLSEVVFKFHLVLFL